VIVIVIAPAIAGSLVYLHDLLVRHQPLEAAVVRVGVGGRLAGAGRRVVRERDPEGAAFAGVERMHLAGHPVRHLPSDDGVRIEQRAIDLLAGRPDVARGVGRAHARTVPNDASHADSA
jgi:hypothetical protein